MRRGPRPPQFVLRLFENVLEGKKFELERLENVLQPLENDLEREKVERGSFGIVLEALRNVLEEKKFELEWVENVLEESENDLRRHRLCSRVTREGRAFGLLGGIANDPSPLLSSPT